MSDDIENPFKRVVAEWRHRGAEQDAHNDRYAKCKETLRNDWPNYKLPAIIREFNAVALEVRKNFTIADLQQKLLPAGTAVTYIEYNVVPFDHLYETPPVRASLRISLRDDCQAEASVKRDDGSDFILPLEGPFPTEDVREVFAALLRDCLKRTGEVNK